MNRVLRVMTTAAGSRAAAFRTSLRFALAATLVQAAGFVVLLPLLSELTADAPRPGVLWAWVGALTVLVALEAVLRERESRFSYDEWPLVAEETRLRLGEKLRVIPQQELGRRAAGDLATVVGASAASAASGASSLATVFVSITVLPAALAVGIVAVDWRLGLVAAAAGVAIVLLLRRVQRASNRGLGGLDRADATTAARVVEYVQGMAVFRATGTAGADSPFLRAALEEQDRRLGGASGGSERASSAVGLVAELALVALALSGAALVLGGGLAAPVLVAVVVVAARLTQPLGVVPEVAKLFESADAATRRIAELDDLDPLPVLPGGAAPAGFEVTFTDVTFTYDGHDRPAVEGVSLTLPERSLTALVGPSGSGKSTLLRLVTRYADPQHGTVRLGGVDLRTVDPRDATAHVAVVFQDVYLFDDTVRANIAMSRPGATDDEVEAAARAAHAHDFVVDLPRGYDTGVGEIGSRLSGGQRQRLSIARAILKDAPVVLLDEPTAALDAESELAVQRAVEELVRGRTVLVIAHRLSTVVGADAIVVLERGRVVERGTHAQLLAAPDGRYRRMWAAAYGSS